MDSITTGCRRNSGLSDFQNNIQAQSALCTAVKTFRSLAVNEQLSEKYAGKSKKFLKKSLFYLKRTMPMQVEEINFVSKLLRSFLRNGSKGCRTITHIQ